MGFPGGTVVKYPPANAGHARDLRSIPGSGRSPGGGNGNPLQSSCLENPMDRGAWWATVHDESDMTEPHIYYTAAPDYILLKKENSSFDVFSFCINIYLYYVLIYVYTHIKYYIYYLLYFF